jgi:hypothetical protein
MQAELVGPSVPVDSIDSQRHPPRSQATPPHLVRLADAPGLSKSALVAAINVHHNEIDVCREGVNKLQGKIVAHAMYAGHFLFEAQKRYGQHGRWLDWLAANVSFSKQTAQVYMRLAEAHDQRAVLLTATSIRQALRILDARQPRPKRETIVTLRCPHCGKWDDAKSFRKQTSVKIVLQERPLFDELERLEQAERDAQRPNGSAQVPMEAFWPREGQAGTPSSATAGCRAERWSST